MRNGASLVDVNAWLGPWPFQYFADETARRLEARLLAEGIGQALVGSPEAAFNPDLMAVNRIHLKRLTSSSVLRPVIAMDPTKGDWRDMLALARDTGAAAVRLFPGYHCYDLSTPAALEAIETLARDGSFSLLIQIRMEDERTHHPLCRIPPVNITSIVDTARRFSGLGIVALCPYYHEAVELGKGPANLCFDISHVERLRTIASLLDDVPMDRVLFGTHVPFVQPRAAVMKVEASYVTEDARRAIGTENARRIVGGALSAQVRSAPARKAAARKAGARKASRRRSRRRGSF